jgi:hypothetical protein
MSQLKRCHRRLSQKNVKLAERRNTATKITWEKVEHPTTQGIDSFYLPKYDRVLAKALEKVPKISLQPRLSTAIIELFPFTHIEPRTGRGYFLINVDGYRHLNCFLISDAILGSN